MCLVCTSWMQSSPGRFSAEFSWHQIQTTSPSSIALSPVTHFLTSGTVPAWVWLTWNTWGLCRNHPWRSWEKAGERRTLDSWCLWKDREWEFLLSRPKHSNFPESIQTLAHHCGAHPVPTGTDAAVALHLGLCSVLIGLIFQGTLWWGTKRAVLVRVWTG